MPTPSQTIKSRAEKFCDLINEHRYKYHVLDDPAISDVVYTSLMNELSGIEKYYSELKPPRFADAKSRRGAAG